ncbi:unnamed protein product [Echinostoma caproni]|uniref:phenylalanine--tRNA ligase n=1 Tax=Echinostoma caproni TaxID=27848 RepID=A0A3P8GK19_9TREM|nr:unnamed protein product [Echinostoma caproni]
MDAIQPPFFYDAQPPSEILFVPLNKDKAYSAVELMDLYATDSHLKPYLPLIQDKPVYPVIRDKNGVVLSMPPIINGEHSRLSVNTRNIFIEATATDLHKAEIVLDTLVTMFSEYCDPPFTNSIWFDSSFVGPLSFYLFSRACVQRLTDRYEVVSIDYINRLLGTEFSGAEVTDLLASGSGLLSVRIPPTRHDILHACDIVEDVAIAYGYDNIPESMPHTYCIAESQPLNRLTDLIRTEIAQMGFTEALSFSLVSYVYIRSAPSKCKLIVHARVLPSPGITPTGGGIEEVDEFCYIGNYISPGGRTKDEVSAHIQRDHLKFTNLRRL